MDLDLDITVRKIHFLTLITIQILPKLIYKRINQEKYKESLIMYFIIKKKGKK